jgi:hypothetical protein
MVQDFGVEFIDDEVLFSHVASTSIDGNGNLGWECNHTSSIVLDWVAYLKIVIENGVWGCTLAPENSTIQPVPE